MRRYLFYTALAVVVLVLVFTAGVWVGTNQDPWTYFTSDQTAKTDSKPSIQPEELVEPDEEDGDSTRTSDDLLIESDPEAGCGSEDSEPHRVSPPPDPVEDLSGNATAESDADSEEGVYAVSTLGVPEIGAGDGASEEITPFIVSTLREESRTWWDPALRNSLNSPLIKKAKDSALNRTYSDPLPEFPYLLIGSVEVPEIEREESRILEGEYRTRVIVSTAMFPELYCTVADGRFALHITETEADMFRDDGLPLRVISPGFTVGGGETVLVSQTDKPITIQLERTKPFVLTLNVSPPEAIADGVFAWAERRGDERAGEDSVFMRSNVPASGRLHFVFAARYGVVRVGVSGEQWHGGLPRTVRITPYSREHTSINIELVPEFSDYVTGTLRQDMAELESRSAPEYEGVKAVRIECTHFGTVSYSDKEGRFEIWAPDARSSALRQLIVNKHTYPEEVVALEPRAESSKNVDYATGGRDVYGPWDVKLQRMVKLSLDYDVRDLKEPAEMAGVVPANGATRVDSDSRGRTLRAVRWGELLFFYRSHSSGTVFEVFLATPEAWRSVEDATRRSSSRVELTLVPLNEVIEDRERVLKRALKRR